MLFIRVLAMKCENCDYELVGFEEEYFLCPKCGNIIVKNCIKVKSKQLIINYSSEFQKKIRLLKKVSLFFSLSSFILFFILYFTLFGFGDMSDVLEYHARRGYTMDSIPGFIIPLIYGATETWINVIRQIFGCKYFFSFRIYVYRVVRIALYIISIYLVSKYVDFFIIPYIMEHHYENLPLDKLALAIKNERLGCQILVIYSFITHIIIEIIDIYVKNCAYNINQEIKKYCEYY